MGTDFTVDWSPLANLGKTFREGQARGIMSELGEGTDPEAFNTVGRKLIANGNLQEGTSLIALGQKMLERKDALDVYKGAASLFGGAAQPQQPQAPRAESAPPPGGPTVLDPSGKLATKDAEGVYGPDAVMLPPGGSPYNRAIAGIESGGRENPYATVGPDNGKGQRPYGKHQVMDFNIGPWTKEILGTEMTPQQFLASPQAQDAVFEAKFGQYVQKYGNPQDAASAWFTGGPLSAGANKSDVLGTSGKSYVDKFNSELSRGVQVAQAGGGPVAMPQGSPQNAPQQQAQTSGPLLPQSVFAGRPVEDWVKALGPLAMHPKAPDEVRKFATEFINSALKGTELTPDEKFYRSYGLQELAAGRVPKSQHEWDLERRKAGVDAAESAESKELGKGAAERANATMTAAGAAAKTLNTAARTEALLSQITQGKVQPALLTVSAWAKSLGLDDAIASKLGLVPGQVGSAQALNALVNESLVTKIGSGGFPANNFSNADREFLQTTLSSIGNDEQANKLLVKISRITASQDIKKAKEWMDFRRKPENKGKSYADFEIGWDDRIATQDLFGGLRREAQELIGSQPPPAEQQQRPPQAPQQVVPEAVRSKPLQQQMNDAPNGSIMKSGQGTRIIKQDGKWVPYNG